MPITILLGGTVDQGGPQHQAGIGVFPNVVRLIDHAGGNFISFLSHNACPPQPLDPGSPQSPEHLESVRFFPSGSGFGLIFLSLLSMALADRDKTSSPKYRAPSFWSEEMCDCHLISPEEGPLLLPLTRAIMKVH